MASAQSTTERNTEKEKENLLKPEEGIIIEEVRRVKVNRLERHPRRYAFNFPYLPKNLHVELNYIDNYF